MANPILDVLANDPGTFGSFASGVQARQGQQFNKLRQSALQQDMDTQKRLNTLADDERKHQEDLAGAERILASPRPAEALRQLFPHLYREGVTDQEVIAGAQQVRDQAMMKLGQVEKPAPQLNALAGPNGETLYTFGNSLHVSKPDNWRERAEFENELAMRRDANKPQAQDTGPLVQIEGQDGKPQWVTREQAIGRPAYVARDKPAAADVKWQREIKSKQPRLAAVVRRVDRLADAILGADEVKDESGKVIKPAVKGISQNMAFDGGPLDKYALAWTKQGQEIKQAIASLLPEITALTRVPGIGSQSDLETRLASLQFPSSEFSPEVNARTIEELKAFVRDLQDVYASAGQEIESAEVNSLLDKYAPQ